MSCQFVNRDRDVKWVWNVRCKKSWCVKTYNFWVPQYALNATTSQRWSQHGWPPKRMEHGNTRGKLRTPNSEFPLRRLLTGLCIDPGEHWQPQIRTNRTNFSPPIENERLYKWLLETPIHFISAHLICTPISQLPSNWNYVKQIENETIVEWFMKTYLLSMSSAAFLNIIKFKLSGY